MSSNLQKRFVQANFAKFKYKTLVIIKTIYLWVTEVPSLMITIWLSIFQKQNMDVLIKRL